jgi:hypothetical protein
MASQPTEDRIAKGKNVVDKNKFMAMPSVEQISRDVEATQSTAAIA